MSAVFRMITGDDWRRGLLAARRRRVQRKAALRVQLDNYLSGLPVVETGHPSHVQAATSLIRNQSVGFGEIQARYGRPESL